MIFCVFVKNPCQAVFLKNETIFQGNVVILVRLPCYIEKIPESWRDYVLFGKEKLNFLREHYPFLNGIPCKNTYARVLAALDPEAFKHCFIEWVKTLQKILNSVIAIDGKTLCNSMNMLNGTSAIHMVSAFATEARLVFSPAKSRCKIK